MGISYILSFTHDIKSYLHNQIPLIIRCKFECIYIIIFIIKLLRVLMAVKERFHVLSTPRFAKWPLEYNTATEIALQFFLRTQAKRSRSLSATNYIKEQSFIEECIE